MVMPMFKTSIAVLSCELALLKKILSILFFSMYFYSLWPYSLLVIFLKALFSVKAKAADFLLGYIKKKNRNCPVVGRLLSCAMHRFGSGELIAGQEERPQLLSSLLRLFCLFVLNIGLS